MDTEKDKLTDTFKEVQGNFVNFTLTAIQAALQNPDQFAAIRKLILERYNASLRELAQKITKCTG